MNFFYDLRGFLLFLFLFGLMTRYKIKKISISLMQEPTITLHLHLKIVPRQHEMHDTSRFKCHALHLHFMK